MFEQGLEEEVRDLLERGVSPVAKPFESLGYKEMLFYITGKLEREQAIGSGTNRNAAICETPTYLVPA